MRIKYVAGTILRVRDVPDMSGSRPKSRSVVLVRDIDADSEDEEAVAQCDWLVDRPLSAIIERLGYVGDKALRDIIAILRERFAR